MKVIRFIFKKVIYSAFLLYGYNFISTYFHFAIPINFYTLSFVSFLGSSGLIGLSLFKYLIL
ncbi:MAG: pro-sigmaK processing inhibitor BofA family protein [Bacilli bacterium]|nr:pro-sigmaK processing inhibitor BofA family protein [Bacilli bacterium]